MLEQPLFYAYFLGLAGLVLGMADTSGVNLTRLKPIKSAAILVSVCGLYLLLSTAKDFIRLAELQTYKNKAVAYAKDNDLKQVVMAARHFSFFTPATELMFPAYFLPVAASNKEKLAFNSRLLHYAPVAETELLQSIYLHADGQLDAARQQFRRAAYAYPAESIRFVEHLSFLAEKRSMLDDPWIVFMRATLAQQQGSAKLN